MRGGDVTQNSAPPINKKFGSKKLSDINGHIQKDKSCLRETVLIALTKNHIGSCNVLFETYFDTNGNKKGIFIWMSTITMLEFFIGIVKNKVELITLNIELCINYV